jgi:hypothetical protein
MATVAARALGLGVRYAPRLGRIGARVIRGALRKSRKFPGSGRVLGTGARNSVGKGAQYRIKKSASGALRFAKKYKVPIATSALLGGVPTGKRGLPPPYSGRYRPKRARKGFGNAPGSYGGTIQGGKASDRKIEKRATKDGWILKQEGSQAYSNGDSIVITQSHGTFKLLKAVVFAMLKKIAKKKYGGAHSQICDPATFLTSVISDEYEGTSSVFNVLYYPDSTSTSESVSATVALPNASTSVDTAVDNIVSNILGIFNTHPQAQLNRIQWKGDSTADIFPEFSFETGKCDFYVENELLVQNRAKNNDATGHDEVITTAMNPVVCTTYEGSGNGPRPRYRRTASFASFTANRNNGLAVVTSGGNIEEEFTEAEFKNCKKKFRDSIDPGVVKKSVISHSNEKVNVGRLFKLIVNGDLAAQNHTDFGSYKMFYLENMVNMSAENIDLAIECSEKYCCVVYGGYEKQVMQSYTTAMTMP